MNTKYKYSVGIKTPANLFVETNHLACYLGETSGDINTFQNTSYRDINDHTLEFAFKQTVVTVDFLGASSGNLPEMPSHAEGVVDITLAQTALENLNQSGGVTLIVALGDKDEDGNVIASEESTALGIPVEMLVSKGADVSEMMKALNIEPKPVQDAI